MPHRGVGNYGGAASAAFEQGGLLDRLKKALTGRALNAEMDHHLASGEDAGNMGNGYGRKTVTRPASWRSMFRVAASRVSIRS